MWNDWVIMYNDRPCTQIECQEHQWIQSRESSFTPYYNLLFVLLLAEDIYGRTQWRDYSSEWCWGDEKKWRKKWLNE